MTLAQQPPSAASTAIQRLQLQREDDYAFSFGKMAVLMSFGKWEWMFESPLDGRMRWGIAEHATAEDAALAMERVIQEVAASHRERLDTESKAPSVTRDVTGGIIE